MKAWEILKHLEDGGTVYYFDGTAIALKDLTGWDYDPIRDPSSYSLTKPQEAKITNKHPEMAKEIQEHRIKTWGYPLEQYVWTKNCYIHKSVLKGK